MNPIEVLIFVGRPLGIVAALAIIGWFTSRRVARQAPGPDPIRRYLDRSSAPSGESETLS
jgi:hypothetical protein